MPSDHETNFGWWVDKPERPSRPAAFTGVKRHSRKADFVWRNLVTIVLLMFAFILAMVYLAKHL